jgi:putative transposase
MIFETNMQDRHSIRLKQYDYSQKGLYFVTICCYDQSCLLGNIYQGQMQLNDFGKIIEETWSGLQDKYDFIILHNFIIMPNHFHGIIEIDKLHSPISLGRLIGEFKSVTYHKCKNFASENNILFSKLWQRNYYDIIIKDYSSFSFISNYIEMNPQRWKEDKYHNPRNYK